MAAPTWKVPALATLPPSAPVPMKVAPLLIATFELPRLAALSVPPCTWVSPL
ncbi:hypothetical protein NB706_003547 [Xanthomonas sacchari]|nr:hypothetical protein [Xanthomonas sacchari]